MKQIPLMKKIEAKDCSPFNKKDPNKTEVQALKELCEYFENTKKGYKDADEKIASLQTRWYKYDNDSEATLQTRWWADRYIGVSNINNVEISIRPRYGEKFLLGILSDLYNIRFVENHSEGKKENDWFSNLIKLLRRRIWVDKCAKANRYGLPRTNVKREHQGATLRGALDVRRTIMPWLMKQEICTNTYEKTLDDNICRIVYEAHRILSRDITAAKKKRDKQTDNVNAGLVFSMPSTVQDTIDALNSQYKGPSFDLTENDYLRIRYKSIYQSWKPLVDYSWDVIRERQLGLKSSNSLNECVFVDMAEIWEAYLRKKLGEGLKDKGWRVLSVEECHFPLYEKMFYKRDIIPDIILQKGDKYIVFDAKYKRMNGSKDDVDRTDLFQIHTYIQYVQHCKGKVILGGLLYPLSVDINNSNIGKFHSMQLFGFETQNELSEVKNEIPFIIDGVYCDEKEFEKISKSEDIEKISKSEDIEKRQKSEDIEKNQKSEDIEETMKGRVKAMIDRIKKYL